MIALESLAKIGRYNKAHGVNGEISATLDVDGEDLSRFSCLISKVEGIPVPFFVNAVRSKKGNTYLLTIDGIATDADCAVLAGAGIYVLKRELEALGVETYGDGEVPLDELVGYEVVDTADGSLGRVVGIDDSTINVLLVVRDAQGRNLLVPAVDDLVNDIDMEGKTISMTLPSGMIASQQ